MSTTTFHAAPKSPAVTFHDAMRAARDRNVGDEMAWLRHGTGRFEAFAFFADGSGQIPRGFVPMLAGEHLHDEIRAAAFALGEAFVRHASGSRYAVETAVQISA